MDELEIVQRLTSLEGKIDTVLQVQHDLSQGIGKRVEEDGKEIAVLKEQVSSMRTLGSWIIMPAIGAIVVAILAMVLRK